MLMRGKGKNHQICFCNENHYYSNYSYGQTRKNTSNKVAVLLYRKNVKKRELTIPKQYV